MMGRIIGSIILLAMAMAALKLALIALVLAGLIFRTKETAGVLFILGAISLFSRYPVGGLVAVGTVALWAWRRANREKAAAPLQPPAPVTNH